MNLSGNMKFNGKVNDARLKKAGGRYKFNYRA
jgi:hypothetical protein